MQGFKIDNEGFYIEVVIYDKSTVLDNNIIIKEIPQGLFKPKWDGDKWSEGATQEYIDSLTVQTEKESTEQEQLLSTLLLENAEIKEQLKEQQELSATLALQIAELKGGNTDV